MSTTKITRTLASAGSARAGKPSLTYCGLLPVLALLVTTSAWSQTAPGFRAPHRPHNMSMAASSAKPTVVTPASASYKFITIAAPDSPYAVAGGINNAGVVTGYYQDSSSNYHGFVWQNGTFQTVDYPSAVDTVLGGLNNRGVAMGSHGDGTTTHTVTYAVSTGTWTTLPDIPNYSQNDGYCINDLGVAVGNAFEGSTAVAWIWDLATLSYSFFTVPGAVQYTTSPSCINDKNQIAGYYVDASGTYQGFIYEYGTYTIVTVPGAADTYLDGINNRGTIQGQIYDAALVAEGFVGSSGGRFTIVNYPGAGATAIVGINDRGDLCGSYGGADFSGPVEAFIAILQ
jgi:probable HAF family extracellular repeat protein